MGQPPLVRRRDALFYSVGSLLLALCEIHIFYFFFTKHLSLLLKTFLGIFDDVNSRSLCDEELFMCPHSSTSIYLKGITSIRDLLASVRDMPCMLCMQVRWKLPGSSSFLCSPYTPNLIKMLGLNLVKVNILGVILLVIFNNSVTLQK